MSTLSRAAGLRLVPRVLGVLAALSSSASVRASGDDVSQCIASAESSLVLRKQGHLQEARTSLVRCASATCPAEIRAECERRLMELATVQPSVVLAARDEAGRDLVDVRVTLDGAPFVTTLGTTAMPVDPGAHSLRFEAAGREGVTRTVVVREGEKARVIQVVLERPVAAPPSVAVGENDGTTQRTVGWVVGGAGVVGLGVGAVFGLMAASKWSDAQAECKAGDCQARAVAQSDHDRALSLATVSTIALVVGGVAAATGAVLVLTAPSSRARPGTATLSLAPLVGPSLAGLWLAGTL